ncbi:MAG: hypothetical protein ABL958_00870 [Bdellovibrionia bacterium]
MKKTIAIAAILAVAPSAFALRGPDQRPVQTACVRTYNFQDGSKVAGCNEANNNQRENKTLLQNGCAAGQVAIKSTRTISIESCLPAGVAQL